ncbi:type I secretion system permease/ATPase [Acidovorax sp. sic0104]|uniref:type I secretion system permease/ATPase n=1 Tax=Acidovorax sp. sic0104 TaxID=2854784 RepID=UPI001C475BDE|nr:type I secretion system permease/ATPase [Acidovorax sp. sic0104]MBV7541658.1 type I secretion system permease/ATPase [Acidovorax sp. sic0104]
MSIFNNPPRGEIAQALWSQRRAWVVVALFSMVVSVMLLTPTLYMLQVYDRVMVSRSELTLLAVSLISLFLFAVMGFADAMRARLLVRLGARLDAVLAERVCGAAFARGVREPEAHRAQPFADWMELRQFLTGPGILAFCDLPWTVVYVVALFLLHPLLGLVAIGFALVQAALAWWGQRRTIAPAEALSQAQAASNSYLQGKLRNAEVVEALGMARPLRQRWLGLHAHAAQRHAALQGLTHRVTAWSKYVRYAQQTASLATGAILVIHGDLTPGAMIAANVLMARALAPIDHLVGVWRGLLGARTAYARLALLLEDYPAGASRSDPRADAGLTGPVAARGLRVAAPGRSEDILQGLDFEAQPGTLTVVMGPSGSGKSTLARALAGAWPVTGGHLSTGGLRVGYLPQETALFNGTVAENIARFQAVNGKVDAPRVVAAAKAAGLHDMVLRLPGGYDTPVGEGARSLSGGQRQRVALARALYGEPGLVVLDEPNSHLDDAGEAALLQSLRGLKERGATIFLVTHRAGALALADQLLVLNDGRVRAQGPRDAVLAQLRPATAVPQALPA